MAGKRDIRGIAGRHGRRCLVFLLLALGATAPSVYARGPRGPDRHGVIHTCHGKADKQELHVIGEGAGCPAGESPLSWNRRGPAGKPASAPIHAGSAAGAVAIAVGGNSGGKGNSNSLHSRIEDAVDLVKDLLLLLSLGALLFALTIVPLLSFASRQLGQVPWLGRRRSFKWVYRRVGPALQIESFEDLAMALRLGSSFALLTQARVQGGHETGTHLYLVTGEERTGDELSALQGLSQTQPLAVALTLLRLLWRRGRLAVTGSLLPVDDDRLTAAVTLSLRHGPKLLKTAEFWLSEPPTPDLTPSASNRVLAVAAAGWIEHAVIDHTPGPSAGEVLLSGDPRSWALFRAGSELSRMSLLECAADLYERALAIDEYNIGALIDLAHLRRRQNHLHGAKALAYRALGLIKERNKSPGGRRNEDDPNWYRVQVVLATIDAEAAKQALAKGKEKKARDRRGKAFSRAIETAEAAMAARRRLEDLVDPDVFESARHGKPLGFRRRLSTNRRARGREPEFDLRTALELHTLLQTTFEPGTLLLVAANAPTHVYPPLPPRVPSPDTPGARLVTGAELGKGDRLDPRVLIEAIGRVRMKSPRVIYNLACYYAILAREIGQQGQGTPGPRAGTPQKPERYLRAALELLRQSVSRMPPLERRALLEHAKSDPDLEAIVEEYPEEFRALSNLLPPEATLGRRSPSA